MLPATLQFLITMIACAINERMQRKLDYSQEEVRVLKDVLKAVTGSPWVHSARFPSTASRRRPASVSRSFRPPSFSRRSRFSPVR
jgi:hypothetical protein